MKRKTKNILTKTLTAVLAVGVVAGTAAGAKAIYDYSKEELKVIHPKFEVGGLNAEGKYVEQDNTLYTKEAFKCDDLSIKLDFDNDINYQIFYYDENDDFVRSTEVLDDDFEIKGTDLYSPYARIMVIPQWTDVEATEDKTLEELQVVNWKNISTFVSQLEIKVNKNDINLKEIRTDFINSGVEYEGKYIGYSGEFYTNELLGCTVYEFNILELTRKEINFEIVITYPEVPDDLDMEEGPDKYGPWVFGVVGYGSFDNKKVYKFTTNDKGVYVQEELQLSVNYHLDNKPSVKINFN